MKETLDDALVLIFGHEGGYVNVRTDKGGPTKYGVTQRTLSNYRGAKASIEDVKLLTLSEAEAIYRQDYAKPIRYDDLPGEYQRLSARAAFGQASLNKQFVESFFRHAQRAQL